MAYPNVQLYINGEWRGARSGKTLPVINPATEEVIGQIAHAERADLDRGLGGADLDDEGVARLRAIIRDSGALARTEERIVALTDTAGPDLVPRYNMYTSVPVQGDTGRGVAHRDAVLLVVAADEDPGAGAAYRRRVDPGPLEHLPRGLQQQPLLRVHAQRLAG